MEHRLRLPENWATQFQLAASPLITGWWPQPGRSIDIVWAKLASGRLLHSPWSRSAGLLAPLALAGVIAWAGHRVARELKPSDGRSEQSSGLGQG